jgi:hypothetical protein
LPYFFAFVTALVLAAQARLTLEFQLPVHSYIIHRIEAADNPAQYEYFFLREKESDSPSQPN